MNVDHRKAEVHYLWAGGLGLLLERAPGEKLPCDGLTSLFFPTIGVGRGGASRHGPVRRMSGSQTALPHTPAPHRLTVTPRNAY